MIIIDSPKPFEFARCVLRRVLLTFVPSLETAFCRNGAADFDIDSSVQHFIYFLRLLTIQFIAFTSDLQMVLVQLSDEFVIELINILIYILWCILQNCKDISTLVQIIWFDVQFGIVLFENYHFFGCEICIIYVFLSRFSLACIFPG